MRLRREIARYVLPCLMALQLVVASPGRAEEHVAAADSDTDLAQKLQNPVAALISVPFQSNADWGIGQRSRGFKYTLNIQPVIPISISEDWNVISRTIVPIVYQEDVVPGTTQAGLGDTLQSLFFSPKKPGVGGIIWGLGPAILLPTSTQDFLGAQKLGLGPTAVVLRQSAGWTYGALANHLSSIGGTHATPVVSSTYLQPFLSYTTKTHATIGIQTESTYDWTDSKWTIPLILPVSQLVKIGDQPISLGMAPKLSVEGPTGAPDWGLRFIVTFLFPTG